MGAPYHLLYPLASSVGYVVGVLLLKRSAAFGIGLWRSAFVANLVTAVVFTPLLALGGHPPALGAWWQPVATAALFFVGQLFTFLAIRGDVSVATPVLGLKILLVALFSTVVLAGAVPLRWWLAAALSTAAIGLLNWGGGAARRRAGTTAVMAALAAAAFALSDVLVQKFTPVWGAGRFLPAMFWLVMLFSLGLLPLFRAPLRSITAPGWRWLLPGAVLLGVQAVGMGWGIGVHGDATAMNIVYSLRGLWSVLAVWWVGHWFHNDEQHLAPSVLRARLGGAVLMCAAIVLVVA